MHGVATKKGQLGLTPPPGFQTMGTLSCDDCGEEFFLWHQSSSASQALAEKQAHWLEKTLAYDHERDHKHCDRIELPD